MPKQMVVDKQKKGSVDFDEHSDSSQDVEEIERTETKPIIHEEGYENEEDDDNEDDDDDDDEDDEDDDDEDDEDDDDGDDEGDDEGVTNELFDDSDVDIQDVLSQFFQNNEGENIPDLMNDLRVAVDNNSKCILKVAKELKTMNALSAKRR